jgi:hypothetical protein
MMQVYSVSDGDRGERWWRCVCVCVGGGVRHCTHEQPSGNNDLSVQFWPLMDVKSPLNARSHDALYHSLCLFVSLTSRDAQRALMGVGVCVGVCVGVVGMVGKVVQRSSRAGV